MFENPGGKLKSVVKAIASTCMVVSVIAGIAIWLMLSEMIGGVGLFIGLILGGVGFLSWWLIGLVLMVVGDMGDNLWNIDRVISKTETGNENGEEAIGAGSWSGTKVVMADGTVKYDNGPEWACKACGHRNASMLIHCYKCGQKKPE